MKNISLLMALFAGFCVANISALHHATEAELGVKGSRTAAEEERKLREAEERASQERQKKHFGKESEAEMRKKGRMIW